MLRVVTPAGSEPVTLADAKGQLGIPASDTSKDDLVTSLISAATREAEALTQRLFVAQTVEFVMNGWEPVIRLPIAPVDKSGVVSIKYVDWVDQAQATLDTDRYVVRTRGPSVEIFPVFGTIWPIVFPFAPEPVVIRFSVGTDVPNVPANVRTAILLTVRHLYSMGERNLFLKRDMVIGLGEKFMQVDPGAVTLLPDAARLLLMPECWS